MLLFEDEINEPATQTDTRILTVIFWFTPEKRFLCQNGVLLISEIEEKNLPKTVGGFARTRIRPVEAEIDGDRITVRGPKGASVFSWREIEEKESGRKARAADAQTGVEPTF